MFVLGLDIGYSNLVIAYGQKGEKFQTRVLPAGAGPLHLLPQRLIGGTADAIQVDIDGEKWAAGVEPERLQGWDRELHGDYPSTKAYRALFFAALLLSEQSRIDMLVTGLPVAQFMDERLVNSLKNRLRGEHQITPKRKVIVEDVRIVPQPTGAFMDIAHNTSDEDLVDMMGEGRTVVIDPGFFSVDWVLFNEGEVRIRSSGTSLKAMSMLLDEMDRLIQEDHGARVGIDRIEKAIRAKRDNILLLGERIKIEPYLDQASKTVAPAALVPLRQSMREDGLNVDVVILAGGGALSYKSASREIFPSSKTVVSDEPVLANGRGFWHCG